MNYLKSNVQLVNISTSYLNNLLKWMIQFESNPYFYYPKANKFELTSITLTTPFLNILIFTINGDVEMLKLMVHSQNMKVVSP